MKRVVLLFALVALVASVAFARGPYRVQAIKQYGLADTTNCQYCHTNPGGGPAWNAFGEMVRANLKGVIGEALLEVAKAMKDSDGDGYEDALEAFAGTLPGDANSKPGKNKDALKAAFEKAGGLDLFKP